MWQTGEKCCCSNYEARPAVCVGVLTFIQMKCTVKSWKMLNRKVLFVQQLLAVSGVRFYHLWSVLTFKRHINNPDYKQDVRSVSWHQHLYKNPASFTQKRAQPAISLFSSLFLSHFLTPLQSETDKLTAATSWCPDCRRECRNKDTHTHKKAERERERKLTHSAAHIKTNYLNSPTLSLSLSSLQFFSASVHMCGRERSAQELKMSELAKPYLKIARFCK